MSEVVEGQSQNDVQQPETADQITALQEQLDRLKSTNERLLEESKSNKTKYQNLAEERESMERQRLEEAGKKEELIEFERNKRHELEMRAKQLEREAMKRALQFEVAARAKDAYDVKDVLGSINPEVVSYDETTSSFKGLDDALASVRSKKPYLFESNKVPSTPAGRPGEMVDKEKTLDERIADNSQDILREALGEFFKN